MASRIIVADALFDGIQLLSDKALVLEDDGTVLELIDVSTVPADVAAFYRGIIAPGLVNAHCHLELSHLREQIEPKTGLPGFVKQIIKKRGEEDKEAMSRADKEMAAQGIVAVGDISNNISSSKVKQASRIEYHTFVEVFDLEPDATKQTLKKGEGLVADLKHDDLNASLALHSPYTCTPSLMRSVAKRTKQSLSIHMSENKNEDKLFADGSGEWPKIVGNKEWFKPTGTSSLAAVTDLLPASTIPMFVHNTYAKEQDVKAATKKFKQSFWCLCPGANWFIERKLPDVEMLLANKVTICLGTDSLASNNQLSIFEEMRMLALKKACATPDLLRWATWNGAAALGMEHLGKIMPGTRPGVILLEGLGEDHSITKTSSIKVLS